MFDPKVHGVHDPGPFRLSYLSDHRSKLSPVQALVIVAQTAALAGVRRRCGVFRSRRV